VSQAFLLEPLTPTTLLVAHSERAGSGDSTSAGWVSGEDAGGGGVAALGAALEADDAAGRELAVVVPLEVAAEGVSLPQWESERARRRERRSGARGRDIGLIYQSGWGREGERARGEMY
jgi:hypothetical protein